MPFESILFGTVSGYEAADAAEQPDCFPDLNLDALVTSLTRQREAYHLAPLFYTPIREPWLIAYRQAVMADIAQPAVRVALERFATTMRQRRSQRAQAAAMGYRLQAQRWELEAAASYRQAVNELRRDLGVLPLNSDGMRAFRDHLADYADSRAFAEQCQAMDAVYAELDAVEYGLLIQDDGVEVRPLAGEADQQVAIETAFQGLRDGPPPAGEAADRKDTLGVTVLEAEILDRVAALFPEAFQRLAAFCRDYADQVEPTLTRFEREIQFYIAYRELMERLENKQGVRFCYPELETAKGDLRAEGAFDLVLADKLAGGGEGVTRNDFRFEGPERVLVVSGPNQGGKTTFARSVGQLHYLAALGLPVPAREARLLHVDAVFTHFDREEVIGEEAGRLAADLERTRAILDRSGPHSLVILNELFQSTQARDAVDLTRRVLAALRHRDALGVCVTFVEEVVRDAPGLVSMVSTRDPDAADQGDYRVVRRPPEGRALAETLAARHALTPGALNRRLGE